MNCVYLSPSVQDFNEYLNGGNEELYMNLVTDSIAKYLDRYDICYKRNKPSMTLPEIIKESNAGDYALHLAIHSNASPESLSGELTGSEVYYFPNSMQGKIFSEILKNKIKTIYPDPENVSTKTTTSFGELRRTSAPSSLVEIAYHDNPQDERWIKENIDLIGKTIADAVYEYITLLNSCPINKKGTVVTMGGNLNLRQAPNTNSSVIAKLRLGSEIIILGCENGWFKIDYNGNVGYVLRKYISV